MSVTCRDLVTATENFGKIAACEAEWRGVCNRAYYSVYHDAKSFWESLAADGYLGNVNAIQKGGMHMDLCTRLVNTDVPKGDPRRQKSRQVGAIMMDMLLKRTKSDYKPEADVDAVEASGSVTGAQNVMSLLVGIPIGTAVPTFPPSVVPAPAVVNAPPTPTPAATAGPKGHLKIMK